MRHSVMIQGIDGTQSALKQRPKSSQQNGLLGNRLRNFKRPEKLNLEELLTEKLIDQRSTKA